jgi:6-phosphogluconolactonase (cycloisomerase 2 family)
MNAGEIIVSPLNARTIYASNRGQVDLNSEIPADAKGDGIAVLTLSEDGTKVESHTIVRTGTNFIRGMGVTKDGRWLATVGQKDGNVEVYECTGARGEELVLTARLEAGDQNGLGVTLLPTDVLWL